MLSDKQNVTFLLYEVDTLIWNHEFTSDSTLLLWYCRFLYQEMAETKNLLQFWLQANMKGWGKKASYEV
jgi:hypothetical protein